MYIDLAKPVLSGAVMTAGQAVISRKALKPAAVKGAIMAGSTAGAEVVNRAFALPGFFGFLENSYGTEIEAAAIFTLIEALAQGDKTLTKAIYNFLFAMGAGVIASYAEAPLYPYIPGFLKQ